MTRHTTHRSIAVFSPDFTSTSASITLSDAAVVCIRMAFLLPAATYTQPFSPCPSTGMPFEPLSRESSRGRHDGVQSRLGKNAELA